MDVCGAVWKRGGIIGGRIGVAATTLVMAGLVDGEGEVICYWNGVDALSGDEICFREMSEEDVDL